MQAAKKQAAKKDEQSNAARLRSSSGVRRLLQVITGEAREIWLRFLAAVVGLALAFAAALFSTVARESGNFWGTLVLSSLALLLAVLVGITTVPMLARRVAGARLRDAFDYDVTRVGILYVVGVLVVGVAALNTGNNLLYIVVASMLAAILVSGFASAIVLRELELDVRLPEHVFAGQALRGRILLKNPRRWLPSFSISVVSSAKKKSVKRWRLLPASFAIPPGRPPEKQWFRLRDWSLHRVDDAAIPPGIFHGSAYFPFIPAGRSLATDLELNFERRGRYQQDSFSLATRFPFAFLTKTRRIALRREIIVYPSVNDADQAFDILPIVSGEFESFVRGRGDDLYRIREYLPEDSARHVDWKATAKSGVLKVREFTREDERKLRIVFDNPAQGKISQAAYEWAVATAATLGWHFARQNAQVTFAAQGFSGSGDVYEFLRYLAMVEPQAGISMIENIIDKLEVGSGYNMVVTAQARGSIPTLLWDCSYFVFVGE